MLHRGGFCVPDLAVEVRAPGLRRMVCVELDLFATVPNVERHVGEYAAVAASWIGMPGYFDELLVAVTARPTPAHRTAIRRALDAIPGARSMPWTVTLVPAGRVAALCRAPLADIDGL